MGTLFDSMQKVYLHQEKMRKFYIDSLQELGVTHSQLGRPITSLDLEEAHYEYVLASFRVIDRETESGKMF
jgi:hypothetical protein